MVPQGNGLAAVLSAHENVLMPLLARAVEPGAAAARAAEALDAVGLGEIHAHLVEELSGGQQQRVAVARGLALASPVLLADEPTSELDHASRAVVLTLLRARAEAGAAVVMTTHDPEAAEAADHVVHLDDGVLVPADLARQSGPTAVGSASCRLQAGRLRELLTLERNGRRDAGRDAAPVGPGPTGLRTLAEASRGCAARGRPAG